MVSSCCIRVVSLGSGSVWCRTSTYILKTPKIQPHIATVVVCNSLSIIKIHDNHMNSPSYLTQKLGVLRTTSPHCDSELNGALHTSSSHHPSLYIPYLTI